MATSGSLSTAYFDALYAKHDDPWSFETSEYERGKYDETIACLDRARYRRAWEAGCSIGVLTQRLSPLCEDLIATDVADAALALARTRLGGIETVRFLKSALPDAPAGEFDLIILSEVLYYLDHADLARAADVCLERLSPQGEVLLVHWLGETPDYPLTGDEAAEGFLKATMGRLTITRSLRRDRYRLDHLRR